jgi:transposase
MSRHTGMLCHEYWKSYYHYTCDCVHHLRGLERAWEQDHQHWIKVMKSMLFKAVKATTEAGGMLTPVEVEHWCQYYQKCLEMAQWDYPLTDETPPGKDEPTQALETHHSAGAIA